MATITWSHALHIPKSHWPFYAKSLQSCPTLCWPHRRQPTRLPRPWDSPSKNTGVGCHFLLQCMKVRSESEVAQSCPTLSDPMDCSLPGSSIHGIFQARVLEWGATAFSDTVCYAMLSHFSRVRLLATPWTAAHQAPPSMGFSRQVYWSINFILNITLNLSQVLHTMNS